jgi:hypothetical protein
MLSSSAPKNFNNTDSEFAIEKKFRGNKKAYLFLSHFIGHQLVVVPIDDSKSF